MLRKGLLGFSVALISVSLLVMTVWAQGVDEDAPPQVMVQPEVAAASVVQTVPVTLTLTLPGPSGPLTVEVPVFLSLDIRIGISSEMTPTLAITPSVVTEVDATPTATSEDTAGTTPDDTEGDANNGPIRAPTATPTDDEPSAEEPSEDEPAATPLPVEPEPTAALLPTATSTLTPEPAAAAPICPDSRAVIVSPGVGETVAGSVNILGTAVHENFLYYKVEYAPGENIDPDATFSYLADARVQVTGGLLASFDSTNFVNGDYTLKLTVVDNSGNFPPPCTVSIAIAN